MAEALIGTYTTKNKIIDLEQLQILGRGVSPTVFAGEFSFSPDGKKWFPSRAKVSGKEIDFAGIIARYLRFNENQTLTLYSGDGYIGVPAPTWSKMFQQHQYWVGGDGLYSFNLNGKDNYGHLNENSRTLFVFGDTFSNTVGKDNLRLEPVAMPNNTYALLEGDKSVNPALSFHINQDQKGHCKAYFTPNNPIANKGSMAANLVLYDLPSAVGPYLSSYAPKDPIEINFSFPASYEIASMEIINYFLNSTTDLGYAKRGIKEVTIYIKQNGAYSLFQKSELEINSFAEAGKHQQSINIHQKIEGLKMVINPQIGIGNYGGADNKEPFFGLNKVFFITSDGHRLIDIKVTSNSEWLEDEKHAWFWLQDGIIIDKYFYSLPLVVTSDLSQPEGFQFAVEGEAMIKVEIDQKGFRPATLEQKATNLYQRIDNREYIFGCAYFDNSQTSGETNADGYIYIYGYSNMFLESDYGRRMRVARVKSEKFADINAWEFFDGHAFVHELSRSAPILDHVSTELSVHRDGNHYLAVFTYDCQSPYICYATAPTPYGPFSEPRVAFVAPEALSPHMYIYNAKAHPHLSKPGEILVSYNINTASMDENMNDSRIYGPRFLYLKKGSTSL